MKEQIIELRLRIDGISKLVKKLYSPNTTLISISDTLSDGELYEIMKTLTTENSNKVILSNTDIKSVTPINTFNIKYLEKSYDSLMLSKAWLGIILQELGEENPYKSGYKTIVDIEPTADVLDGHIISDIEWNDFNHIERVDWIRQQIKDVIDNTQDFSEEIDYIKIEQSFVYQHLSEARFYLGFELARIRDTK